MTPGQVLRRLGRAGARPLHFWGLSGRRLACSQKGAPVGFVHGSTDVEPCSPDFAPRLLEAPWFQSGLVVLLTPLVNYTLDWGVSQIWGRWVLHALEAPVSRVRLGTKVDGSTKQLVQSFQ